MGIFFFRFFFLVIFNLFFSGRKECFYDKSGIVFNQLFGFYDKSGIVSGRRKFTISLAYSIFFYDKSGSMPEGERPTPLP